MTSVLNSCFINRKRSFIERLRREHAQGLVDFDLVDFLLKFNELAEDYYTTSSCSGRIILAETKRLSLAKSSHEFRFIRKWHRPVTLSEVVDIIQSENYRNVWLLVRAPIIHFAARTLQHALKLLRIAQAAGFKHSGIISIREDGEVIIEVQADDRLDVPIIVEGNMLLSRDKLRELIDLANETLMIGKIRLANLIGLIERDILKTYNFQPIELSKMKTYREFSLDEAKMLAEQTA